MDYNRLRTLRSESTENLYQHTDSFVKRSLRESSSMSNEGLHLWTAGNTIRRSPSESQKSMAQNIYERNSEDKQLGVLSNICFSSPLKKVTLRLFHLWWMMYYLLFILSAFILFSVVSISRFIFILWDGHLNNASGAFTRVDTSIRVRWSRLLQMGA